MPQLVIRHTDLDLLKALTALAKQHSPDLQMTLLQEIDIPCDTQSERQKLVVDISDALKPHLTNDWGYRKFLLSIWAGEDSWEMSKGDKFCAPTADSAKVTNKLKKRFPDRNIVKDHLFKSKQINFEGTSDYRGMKYILTPLGREVLDFMQKRGDLSTPDPIPAAA